MTANLEARPRDGTGGFALIIVLALVVLLTVLVVAFFSRTTTARQSAAGSLNQVKADELARSALNIVAGDLMQEIVNGGIPPSAGANVVPVRSGNLAAIPNLIRRSVRSDSIAAPGIASRASAISSSDPSANTRFVSASRWNSHFLIPKLNLGNDEPEPIAGFVPPDWVLVSRSGPAKQTALGTGARALSNSADANPTYVIGRYAYAIYDEGGLLDMNIAGYPSPTPAPTISGRKGSVAFADLTALPTTSTGFVTNTVINRIIGWRNYATVQPAGNFPSFTFSQGAVGNFVTYFLDRNRSFLTVSQSVTGAGTTRRTDQAFITRSELIKLRASTNAGAASMLQFLGTFSREINRSTWSNSSSLLASRWPLGRFDLFANTPPVAADAALIQQHFGLVYVPAAATPEHWQYNGTTGVTRQSAVGSLGPGSNQDPELFVLLKYALPAASDTELLSIGASLIDQRDSDLNTTWIEFGNPSLPPQKAFGADSTPPLLPSDPRPASAPVMLKRSFRNVGDLGYAYRNASTTLDFQTNGSADAPLLDLFTYNTAAIRAGPVSLNTRNSVVLAALLKGAIVSEASSASVTNTNSTTGNAITAANSIVAETITNPAVGKKDVARLASGSVVTNTPFTTSEEARETVSRALAELGQTRTWGLLIDVIAQSGRYPPSATNLNQFVVGGEKRYWLHIAIDRFTGQVIDQQLEAVYE